MIQNKFILKGTYILKHWFESLNIIFLVNPIFTTPIRKEFLFVSTLFEFFNNEEYPALELV